MNKDRLGGEFGGIDQAEKKPEPQVEPRPKKAVMDKELEAIALKLKSKDVKIRAKAIEELAAKGEAAVPAAQHLCDAMMDKNEAIALSALAALEKVRPDLYKPLVELCIDKDASTLNPNHPLKILGEMGEDAAPVLNLLVSRMKSKLLEFQELERDRTRRKGMSLNMDTKSGINFANDVASHYWTIERIRSGHLELKPIALWVASDRNASSFGRLDAIRGLLRKVGDDKTEIKKLLPVVQSGLSDYDLLPEMIKIYGELGSLSKEMLPALKRYKLSDRAEVRQAADIAVELIEEAK